MATPAQHATAVEAFVTRTNNPALLPPSDVEAQAAEVHAHLSVATGTGDDYTAADTLLTEAEAAPAFSRRTRLIVALTHAIRAER